METKINEQIEDLKNLENLQKKSKWEKIGDKFIYGNNYKLALQNYIGKYGELTATIHGRNVVYQDTFQVYEQTVSKHRLITFCMFGFPILFITLALCFHWPFVFLALVASMPFLGMNRPLNNEYIISETIDKLTKERDLTLLVEKTKKRL